MGKYLREYGLYIGQSSALPKHVLDFRYAAPFRNKSASKVTTVKKSMPNFGLCDLVKIKGGISEIPQQILPVRPGTKPLIYF